MIDWKTEAESALRKYRDVLSKHDEIPVYFIWEKQGDQLISSKRFPPSAMDRGKFDIDSDPAAVAQAMRHIRPEMVAFAFPAYNSLGKVGEGDEAVHFCTEGYGMEIMLADGRTNTLNWEARKGMTWGAEEPGNLKLVGIRPWT